ncbi:MAG: hypothetical protein HZB39_02630 [Planctomycetes bacterium]|nr:hypothetical protein [Planctomycetota bacterium]
MNRAAIVAFLLLGIAAIVWLVFGASPDALEHAEVSGAAGAAGATSPGTTPTRDEVTAPRQDLTVGAAAHADGGEEAKDAIEAATDDALTGRVVDAGDRPIAGADCFVLAVESDGFSWLDRGEVAEEHEVARVTTDALGRFAVPLPAGVPHRLRVAATDCGTERSGPHVAGERVVVRLHAGSALVGRITLDGDGVALSRVRVRCAGVAARRVRYLLGESVSDASGAYRIDGLPAGEVEVEVMPPRGAVPGVVELVLAAGVATPHDVALTRGADVAGLVLDAATRTPIAGASVGLGWRGARPTRTAADGRFVYRDFPSGYRELGVTAQGYGDAAVIVSDPDGVKGDVEILLTRAHRAHGRVVRPDGRGIAGAYVAAAAYERVERSADRLDWRASRSGADGGFAIDGLRGDVDHVLLVRAAGHGVRQVDFPPGARGLPDVPLGDVVLEPGVVVRGVVVDERGSPWAGVDVQMRGDADGRSPRGSTPVEGYRAVDGYVASRSARTDQLGRFGFVDVAPGEYRFAALRELGRPDRAHALRVERDRPAVLRIELARGLSIGGRVVADDGGPPPHCYVSVDPTDGAATSTDVQCAQDGSFLAIGLARGVYRLSVYPYASEIERAAGRVFEPVTADAIAAGRLDVVVTLVRQR